MSDEKVLTKEIAEQFLADEDSVDLSEFTAIEDDAAEALGKFDDPQNHGLKLSGIKHLPESTARHLRNFKRDIDISGLVDPSEQSISCLLKNSTTLKLKQISDEFAKTLSRRRSLPYIQLECFPALSGHLALATTIVGKDPFYKVYEVERIVELHPEIAKAFAQSPAALHFASVNDISVSVAEALATHKKGLLWLPSVESVSEDVAKVLSKHGPKLLLSNLASIENTKGHKKLLKKLIKSQPYAEFAFNKLPMWLAEEILNNLAKAKYAEHISFPCLTSIDLDVLLFLCDYKLEGYPRQDLELDGFADLPEGAAEAISSHSGSLSLKGVTSITDAVAESLGRHRGMFNVSGLTQLSSVGAEHLAKSENDLYLNGLVKVDADVAEALSRHTGDRIILDGVKSMSLSALQALTRYVGKLILGVTTLDAEQAEALSCHQNELEIGYVTQLDTAAAKCLTKHRRLISMKSLSKLPVDAAKELAQRPGPIRVVLEKLPKKSADLLKKAFPNELGCTLRK